MLPWFFDQKYRQRFFYHAILFVLLTAVVVIWSSKNLQLKPEVHWLTLINFIFLTTISYVFFAVNLIYAKKIKTLSLSVGFFTSFIGFALLTLGLAYQSDKDILLIMSSFFGSLGYAVTAYGTFRWVAYNMQVKREILMKTERDELSALLNRRAWAGDAQKEVWFAIKTESPLALLVIDIDDFKAVNDRYGHDVGDVVIKYMASLLSDKVRKTDSVYRWGGEEFIVLLPVTDLDEAFAVASKLLLSAEESMICVNQNQLRVTLSAGVAQWRHGESLTQETFRRADHALLIAKQSGKNKAVKA